MELVRLAVIGLSETPKQTILPSVVSSDGVNVELIGASNLAQVGKYAIIAKAYSALQNIEITADGLIVLPQDLRRRSEMAIERAADLFALATRARRQVFSATPSVALIPENADDQEALNIAIGFKTDAPRSINTFCSELDLKAIIGTLSDRWNGVTLMAEAYSHGRMSARYREFVRLFELAFSRDFTQMHKMLAQALNPAMGYTTPEVRTWQALRHPFIHADRKKTKEIALESDARDVTQRMEQASVDILLNKAAWGAWSADRREVWKPEAFTASASGNGIVRQGSSPRFEFLVLDEFGVFPIILGLQHTNLPATWWHRAAPPPMSGR